MAPVGEQIERDICPFHKDTHYMLQQEIDRISNYPSHGLINFSQC